MIYFGAAGMISLLINRLSLTDVGDVQSRADIIAVVACAAAILNAINAQEIVSRDRESVSLVGYSLNETVIPSWITGLNRDTIRWVCTSLIRNTQVKSLIVVSKGVFIAKAGIINKSCVSDDRINMRGMTILQDSVKDSSEVYLPDLQVI